MEAGSSSVGGNPTRAARLARIEEVRRGLVGTVDGLGHGLDEGIVEAVVVINTVGFPTRQSCEGHAGHGLPYPWIDVQAGGQPRYRFDSERRHWEAAYAEVAASVGTEDRRGMHSHHWEDLEAAVERQQSGDPAPRNEKGLPEWEAWWKKQKELEAKFESVLGAFLSGEGAKLAVKDLEVRSVEYFPMVRVAGFRVGEGAVLDLHGDEEEKFLKEISQDEASLARRREALYMFVEWLREKYLAGEDFVAVE
ncbi:MAG TPA: hypothetical protein VJJ47_02100 [Candidatus Paceibacterota bacterium]